MSDDSQFEDELAAAYAAAWTEWIESGEAAIWECVTADGLAAADGTHWAGAL